MVLTKVKSTVDGDKLEPSTGSPTGTTVIDTHIETSTVTASNNGLGTRGKRRNERDGLSVSPPSRRRRNTTVVSTDNLDDSMNVEQPRSLRPRRGSLETLTSVQENAKIDGQKGNQRTCGELKSKKRNKCKLCEQFEDELQTFSGDPDDAVEELNLFDFEKLFVVPDCLQITMFSIYDEKNHLCRIDSGLLEKGRSLYCSGYVKQINANCSSIDDGVYVKRLGPLKSWWIANFDGGDQLFIGISSDIDNMDYRLTTPATEYDPFAETYLEKVMLVKYVSEFVRSNPSASFEDMCDSIHSMDPRYDSDRIFFHAGFVINQIIDYDSYMDEDEIALMSTRPMKHLQDLAGEQIRTRRKDVNVNWSEKRERPRTNKDAAVKAGATTTPRVNDLLGAFFKKLCADSRNELSKGKQKKSKSSELKPFVLDVASDDEDKEDDMDEAVKFAEKETKRKFQAKDLPQSTIIWKNFLKVEKGVKYYSSVEVDHNLISVGDSALFHAGTDVEPYVGKIKYLFSKGDQNKMHVVWFWRGTETILGETAAGQSQIFASHNCDDVDVGSVIKKCNIEFVDPIDNFNSTYCVEIIGHTDERLTFTYSLMYEHDTGTFRAATDKDEACKNHEISHRFCASCNKKIAAEQFEVAIIDKENVSFSLRGESYAVGECVFLKPDSYKKMRSRQFISAKAFHASDYDPVVYPERYRKTSDVVCGGNSNVPDPFIVARIIAINSIKKMSDSLNLQVALFYRPENTIRGDAACYNTDYNELFWTNEKITVPLSSVIGKCVVANADYIDDLEEFRLAGPHRFYFRKRYDVVEQLFIDMPKEADKYDGTGKTETYKDYPKVSRVLRALDVFSGCGGLSNGFHRASISETCWAIEKDPDAAQAYKINNPNCAVFEADCNDLLKLAMSGKAYDPYGRPLPKKGDVDMIMGGPPCQGFSGMNRFNSREYSLFQSSLIATLLSYCDFYRPKYFLLENVRNFVSYKKNMVLRLVLNCLISMGYQCSFAVLQAGHYGVPQTRRRLFIWAAAPNQPLPKFPEPQHVFNKKCSQLSVCLNGSSDTLVSNIRWINSAPYRCVTVRDALDDLPPIGSGDPVTKTCKYVTKPISHFQKLVRIGNRGEVNDHVTKVMSALAIERFRHVPKTSGSDWRDLPNIEIRRGDVVIAKILEYNYLSRDGKRRGVCSCSDGKSACQSIRQHGTLQPWCLPHTAGKHNNWAGLFGRLAIDGYFMTTITNPEPMGKQGVVVHPTQDRVVSVRECARSQGFLDNYKFYGNSAEPRHRQIGNAVPPPLAEALAMELRKCLANFDHCAK